MRYETLCRLALRSVASRCTLSSTMPTGFAKYMCVNRAFDLPPCMERLFDLEKLAMSTYGRAADRRHVPNLNPVLYREAIDHQRFGNVIEERFLTTTTLDTGRLMPTSMYFHSLPSPPSSLHA